jgi:hypothetical protein
MCEQDFRRRRIEDFKDTYYATAQEGSWNATKRKVGDQPMIDSAVTHVLIGTDDLGDGSKGQVGADSDRWADTN